MCLASIEWGSIADWFAAVVSLVSIILFVRALKLQRDELESQQEELRLTRVVAKEQSETLRVQQIEGTFFDMLGHLQNMGNNFEVPSSHGMQKGPKFFERVYSDIVNNNQSMITPEERQMEENLIGNAQFNIELEILNRFKGTAVRVYESGYSPYQNELGHYFRFLFNIIKFIHHHPLLKPEEKRKYINLIQAQMSNYELGLLFYNALSRHGGNHLFAWLEEYGFLDNIDRRALILPRLHSRFYPNTKFKFLDQPGL